MTWGRALIADELVFEFDDIVLDIECLRVRRAGRLVHLGSTEFVMLVALIETPGKVWTRAALVDRVWGRDARVEARTVDVHVARLRKALCQTDKSYPIRTVHGVGYALG
ncbi:Phosphate regulon transcriptional regulatory protein PhoB [Sulfitobacter sp. DSM 110093]|uniref:winged helix-turn-helix domain-containing protein n=1 Tax=Sulfitobacter sp. DSM 110093 TaxID=2883127 RepID=UPI001FACF714|nr:winged helix-turn-helix domain-containing protein [Sulfitobacter sp. DSM 110093]UOA33327.1 Phosphate regulon transcriptional regulatory protein PhoB [Sulfitobacter sp. DSM 110093]